MNFFDFIFDNLFIVAIVLIGLFNLFSGSGKKKASEQQQQQQQEQKPSRREVFREMREREHEHPSQRSAEAKPLGRLEGAAERIEQKAEELGRRVEQKIDDVSRKQKPSETLAEQRQAQMERIQKELQQQHSHTHTSHSGQMERSIPAQTAPTSKSSSESKAGELQLNKKLTTSGLMDSVVMAEVLGPPRAMQPYRNIAATRQQRR